MRMQVSLIYKSEIIYILGSKYDNIFAFGEILKKENNSEISEEWESPLQYESCGKRLDTHFISGFV